jgi:hypothetical protein
LKNQDDGKASLLPVERGFMKFPNQPWTAKLLMFGLCGGAIAAMSMTPTRHDERLVLKAPDRDLAALFAARSPGARPDGAFAESKPIMRLADLPKHADAPRQYALPRVRERMGGPGPFAPDQPFGPMAAVPQDAGALPLDRISNAAGPGPGFNSPGGGYLPGDIVIPPTRGPVPPGGGGGGGGPNPMTPVPEPMIWIQMIGGLGIVGVMLRSRRRVKAGPNLTASGHALFTVR